MKSYYKPFDAKEMVAISFALMVIVSLGVRILMRIPSMPSMSPVIFSPFVKWKVKERFFRMPGWEK